MDDTHEEVEQLTDKYFPQMEDADRQQKIREGLDALAEEGGEIGEEPSQEQLERADKLIEAWNRPEMATEGLEVPAGIANSIERAENDPPEAAELREQWEENSQELKRLYGRLQDVTNGAIDDWLEPRQRPQQAADLGILESLATSHGTEKEMFLPAEKEEIADLRQRIQDLEKGQTTISERIQQLRRADIRRRLDELRPG